MRADGGGDAGLGAWRCYSMKEQVNAQVSITRKRWYRAAAHRPFPADTSKSYIAMPATRPSAARKPITLGKDAVCVGGFGGRSRGRVQGGSSLVSLSSSGDDDESCGERGD
jgi:hypothetical protein